MARHRWFKSREQKRIEEAAWLNREHRRHNQPILPERLTPEQERERAKEERLAKAHLRDMGFGRGDNFFEANAKPIGEALKIVGLVFTIWFIGGMIWLIIGGVSPPLKHFILWIFN